MAEEEPRPVRISLSGWDKIQRQIAELGERIEAATRPIAAQLARPEVQEAFRQAGRMNRGMADDQPAANRAAWQALHDADMTIPEAMKIMAVLPEPHKKPGRPEGPSFKGDAALIEEMILRVDAGERRGAVAEELAARADGAPDLAKNRLIEGYKWARRKRRTARQN